MLASTLDSDATFTLKNFGKVTSVNYGQYQTPQSNKWISTDGNVTYKKNTDGSYTITVPKYSVVNVSKRHKHQVTTITAVIPTTRQRHLIRRITTGILHHRQHQTEVLDCPIMPRKHIQSFMRLRAYTCTNPLTSKSHNELLNFPKLSALIDPSFLFSDTLVQITGHSDIKSAV